MSESEDEAEETPPKPFSILKGDKRHRTGVQVPRYTNDPPGRPELLSPEERIEWRNRRARDARKELLDPVEEANRQMLPDNDKYPQDDDETPPSEGE
jgi:hypothetical protein